MQSTQCKRSVLFLELKEAKKKEAATPDLFTSRLHHIQSERSEKVCSLRSLIMAQGLIFSRDSLKHVATVESAECLFSGILRPVLHHFSSALAITAQRIWLKRSPAEMYISAGRISFFKGVGSGRRSPVAQPDTLVMLQGEETLRAVCDLSVSLTAGRATEQLPDF